ncbi:MAG TPA: CDP-alcohol phosphatidyltransferase family protein [Acidimicrobiales bacterium]|nr:CDP-alcohol phosphatidyltransferase family protein [Acidimicrobiales bacterium]
MFDGQFRSQAEKQLRPIGTNLRKTGITADHLTVLGVVMAGVTALAVANGALRLGILLLVLCAVPDVLDGAVAKASGTASPRGAFFDSVCDRVSDALLLGGVAWYLSSQPGAGRIAVLPLAVLAASLVISYERAKAEALGYDARGGLMERAERLVAIGLALLFPGLMVAILWLTLALTVVTAAQRFAKVWRQASSAVPPRPATARERARRQVRVSRTAARRTAEGRRSARERFAARDRFGSGRRNDR